MHLDIRKLLLKRLKYPMHLSRQVDGMVEQVLKNDSSVCSLILTENYFHWIWRETDLSTRYHVIGMFGLSNPYNHLHNSFTLYILSKERPQNVKTGKFLNSFNKLISLGLDYQVDDFNKLIRQESELDDYFNLIEGWVKKTNKMQPASTSLFWFNTIPYHDFDYDLPFTKHYSIKALNIKKAFQQEKHVLLRDVADIFNPCIRTDSQEEVPLLYPSNFKYPIQTSSLKMGKPTTVLLQKGDIVFSKFNPQRPGMKVLQFLIMEELENVYASRSLIVVRPHRESILPEYLFTYFETDVGQLLLEMATHGDYISMLTGGKLRNVPVALQKEPDEIYKSYIELYYKKRIEDYYDFIHKKPSEPDSVASFLLRNQQENIMRCLDETVQNMLKSDINELNRCFDVEAYKATLILAGAILESFLLYWLGIKDDKDYFKTGYQIPVENDINNSESNSNHGTQRPEYQKGGLADIINAIFDSPEYAKAKSLANQIREKRNWVHGERGIKAIDEINEETCSMIINYLVEIIRLRFPNE